MGRLKNDHVEVPLNTGGLYDRFDCTSIPWN